MDLELRDRRGAPPRAPPGPRGGGAPPPRGGGGGAPVTGATRGIGRAIAERLASEGCALVICARDGGEVDSAATELQTQRVAVHGRAVDVTDSAALERFLAEAGDALGGLDPLVANAGRPAGGET